MMIPWWEHDEKGVTDVQTDRQTDRLNQSNSCLVAAKNNRAPLLCYFKPCKSFHSHWTIQARVSFRKRQIRVKISDFFCPVWPWNLTDDLLKQLGTSSMLLQAWSVISWPSVNSNWGHSPETPNFGQNRQFFVMCDLEIWQTTLKNKIGHLFYTTSSSVHHFVAICEFKLELESGNG